MTDLFKTGSSCTFIRFCISAITLDPLQMRQMYQFIHFQCARMQKHDATKIFTVIIQVQSARLTQF